MGFSHCWRDLFPGGGDPRYGRLVWGLVGLSTEFLDDGDLERLTGYKRAADQARWLDDNGFPFILNAKGKPVVRRGTEKHLPEPELGPIP
ncbi:MAG: DUF4224 domain-containing protein [Gemmatimonadales bacterium]